MRISVTLFGKFLRVWLFFFHRNQEPTVIRTLPKLVFVFIHASFLSVSREIYFAEVKKKNTLVSGNADDKKIFTCGAAN